MEPCRGLSTFLTLRAGTTSPGEPQQRQGLTGARRQGEGSPMSLHGHYPFYNVRVYMRWVLAACGEALWRTPPATRLHMRRRGIFEPWGSERDGRGPGVSPHGVSLGARNLLPAQAVSDPALVRVCA